jgi:two-component system sensor histidine kinase KdpD
MAAYVGRGATLLATFLSAVLWDFFFEPPIYSFNIFGFDDQLLFGLYFVIALVLGQLTVRIRRQELAERERQERVEALQVLTRELAGATGFDEMLGLAARRITAVFDFRVAILLPSSVSQLSPHQTSNFQVTEKEMPVAVWAYENGLAAGKYTANFTTSPGLYLPLTGYDTKLGILGLEMIPSAAPGVHQRDLLDAFAEQIALAINRYRISEILEKAKLTSESARLGKTLLNSISHEIRTPLTIIQTATTNALDSDLGGLSDYQRRMLSEIPEATGRLNRLVGKLLDITRLESGHVKPKLELCEVSELVQVAEGETREELSGHKVTIQLAPDLPLVPMDFELLLHSLTNLLSNAAFHTPTGAKHN